jgi:hypothetical protein
MSIRARAIAGLAWLEILGGLFVGCGGSIANLATDASLALIGAVFAFIIGTLIASSGALLLLSRHRLRGLAQVIPAAIAAWLLIAWLRS